MAGHLTLADLPAPTALDPWGLAAAPAPVVDVCAWCSGAGEVVVGYDADDFQILDTCRRCHGSGDPQRPDNERGAA